MSDETEGSHRVRGEQPDVDTIKGTCEEGRRTFEYQVKRLQEIDSKAIEILRANLLIIGVLVTALSIAVQAGVDVTRIANVFTILGGVILLISTGLAGVTYTASNIRGGVGQPAIERTITQEYTEREFYEVLARSYGEWIEYNSEVTAANDILVTVTIIFVVDAFVLLTAGVLVSFLDPPFLATLAVFVVLLVGLTTVSYIVYGMDHIDEGNDD